MKTWAISIVMGLAGAALAAPPTLPVIQAQDAYPINSTSAQVNATVLSAGGSEATLPILYWGRDDGGTNAEAWEYSYWFTSPCTSGAPVSLVLTGLESGRNYAYTFAVTNEAGATWASNSIWFDVPLGDWWVQQQPGQFPLMGSTRVYESAGGNNALSNSVLWYSFGQTNNGMYEPIFDQTLNGHAGSNFYPSGYTREWAGNYAYLIRANDANGVKTHESGLLSGSSEMTLALWVYEADVFAGECIYVVNYGDSTPSSYITNGIRLYRSRTATPTDYFYFQMGPGGINNANNIGMSVNMAPWPTPFRAWYRVVSTYKRGPTSLATMSLYVDGQLVQSQEATYNIFVYSPSTFQFGGYPYVPNYKTSLSGYIDDLVIDDVAWTPAQVAADYAAGRSRLSEFFDGPSLISGPNLPDGASIISREE